MWKANKKGQSTVEYILLVTAVVSVAIIFLTNKESGLQKKMDTTLNQVSDGMLDKATLIKNSYGTTNAASPVVNGFDPNVNPLVIK